MVYFFNLKKRIKANEGFSTSAYLDQLGFLTIGYGHLIKKEEKHLIGKNFSKKFLKKLFDYDFKAALQDYNKIYKKEKHLKHIKEFLIEMIFQMGPESQKKFIKANTHIKNQNLFMAALEIKNSLWYSQTPKRIDMLLQILLKKHYEKKR